MRAIRCKSILNGISLGAIFGSICDILLYIFSNEISDSITTEMKIAVGTAVFLANCAFFGIWGCLTNEFAPRNYSYNPETRIWTLLLTQQNEPENPPSIQEESQTSLAM